MILHVHHQPSKIQSSDELIGSIQVPLGMLAHSDGIDGWYHITDADGHSRGQLKVSV